MAVRKEQQTAMAVEVICPDCGGVIGGVGIDAEGRGPCTCFSDERKFPRLPASRPEVIGDPADASDPSDTVSLSAPSPGQDLGDNRPKVCIVCGKNVTGHRRVKDSRGYLCYACAKAEVAQERAGKIPCAECGRRVKEGGIVVYNGLKICRRCFEDHKQAKRKAIKKVSTHHFDAHEKLRLIYLAIIFVVLGLIVLWQQLKR